MKRILTIWRDMTGAERAVLAAATLALAVTVVAAPFALLKRPDDVSNPDAAFAREEGAGKEKEPKPAKTVNWTRYGYDIGRSKFLDSPKVRPPFRKVWKYTGDELIEFPPIVRRRPALLHRQRRRLRRARTRTPARWSGRSSSPR